MKETVDKVLDKLPTQEEFRRNTGPVVGYVFMLFFFMYFVYKEFMQKDDCGARIATLERLIDDKEKANQVLINRVSTLEKALDVKNGVLHHVEVKADSISTIGGSR